MLAAFGSLRSKAVPKPPGVVAVVPGVVLCFIASKPVGQLLASTVAQVAHGMVVSSRAECKLIPFCPSGFSDQAVRSSGEGAHHIRDRLRLCSDSSGRSRALHGIHFNEQVLVVRVCTLQT